MPVLLLPAWAMSCWGWRSDSWGASSNVVWCAGNPAGFRSVKAGRKRCLSWTGPHCGVSSCIPSIPQVQLPAFSLRILALNKNSKCTLRQRNTSAASAPLNWNTWLKDQKLLWLTSSTLKCFLNHKLRAKIYKFVSWSINLDLLLSVYSRQMACRGNCSGLDKSRFQLSAFLGQTCKKHL